jgi:CDP-4-dehydro-6-deoxyglucose reductase
MFNIKLKNGKSFNCDSNTTVFEAAKNNGNILEHSCLTARCRSCAVQVESGNTIDKLDDLVLSTQEKSNRWILSCNSIPTSDLVLDIEDLGDIKVFEKKIIPAKIQAINKLNDTVIEVSLRLPPNSNFGYNSGQYVNITKGSIKRSYSVANAYRESGLLTFLIKKYENGQMSNYWFKEAKENDLLRIEGPIGSFFLRESEVENIIFLATGTGVAPIKAILESITEAPKKLSNKKIWIFSGARNENDIFWNPNEIIEIPNLKYIPVMSRASKDWKGEKGYVQDILIKQNIPLVNAQVYACGSNNMIESAKKILIEKGLNKKNFFSDAFVATN